MKAIVLFSGGLDSTTALVYAIKKHEKDNVIALNISYGQKHNKEILCAKNIASYYDVELKTLDLSEMFKSSNCSLLAHSTDQIKDGDYVKQIKENNIVNTYVPFRNGLFLSVAATMALEFNVDIIYYAIHKNDNILDAYPDTSEVFNKSISDAIYYGTGKKVCVDGIFVNKTKADIVKLGLELNVRYDLTTSCYNGNDVACGKCATCIDRLKAFELNNAIDPIAYEVN